ncbi:kinase family protein [Striga asiatica]|uniref:non-specific serine/threonine protein kinase n=1 Tax=Striga asiatica TaxID=4170 RepID=A0A5A7PRZ4_STRAF|nr:kinase family protein [Striga asiatica]
MNSVAPHLAQHCSCVSLGLGVLVLSSFIIFYIKRSHNQDPESNEDIDKVVLGHGSLAPKRYGYKEIKKITKSFSDKLGQGGYGTVYKGKLPDGQLVAVKVLTETGDNAQDFISEVSSISKTSHVNIVNLLGFCYKRNKRALVYEFMPNKSLDNFISNNASPVVEWEKLFEIALGVGRGLEYLHRGCNTRIVHFDIKPQNILLDEELSPKISDFGIANLFKKKQSIKSKLGPEGLLGTLLQKYSLEVLESFPINQMSTVME